MTINNVCVTSTGARDHGLARRNYTQSKKNICCMWTICTKAQESVGVMYIVQDECSSFVDPTSCLLLRVESPIIVPVLDMDALRSYCVQKVLQVSFA